MKIADLVGKNVLFVNWPVSKHAIHEGRIKEISPSKNFVKISNDWYLIENLRILELFPEEKRAVGLQ